MNNLINGQKKEKYSLRKLSVGLVSTTIASLFTLFAGNPVQAVENNQSAIQYKYVTESELTEEEKQLIIKEVPKFVEKTEDTYYLVYKKDVDSELPKTGESNNLGELTAGIAALGLIVLVVKTNKKRSKYIATALLVTSMGTQVVEFSALGLTSKILEQYNEKLVLNQGETLPLPKDIKGYKYIGYIKANSQTIEDKKEIENIKPEENNEKKGNDIEKPKENFESKVPTENIPVVEEKPIAEIVEERETEEVPFETKYVENKTLKAGEEREVQAGKNGTRIKVYNVLKENGKEVNRVQKNTEEVAPIARVVERGEFEEKIPNEKLPVAEEKPTAEIVEERETEEVPFETKYVENKTLKAGEEREVQAGKNGMRTKVYDVLKENGKEVNRVQKNTEEVAPIARVVERGEFEEKVPIENIPVAEEKPTAEIVEERETEEVPFETKYVENETLKAGEEREKTAGVNGTRTKVYDVLKENGKEVNRVQKRVEEVEPIAKVIEQGTFEEKVPTESIPVAEEKPTAEIVEERETEEVPFETKYVENKTLKAGEEREVQAGKNGMRTKVYDVLKENGKEVNRVQKRVEEVEPIAKVIEQGTFEEKVPTESIPVAEEKPTAEIVEERETEEVPFETKYVENETLRVGEEREKTAGVNGTRTKVYDVLKENGKEINRVQKRVEEVEPVAKVIEQGTFEEKVPTENIPVAEEKTTINLAELAKLLAEKETVEESVTYYQATQDKQSNYNLAINNLKNILSSSETTQQVIDDAVSQVNRAKDELNGREPDKTRLNSEYQLKDETKEKDDYTLATPDKKAAYDQKLVEAKAILDNPKSRQDEIDRVKSELTESRERLDGRLKEKPTLSIETLEKNELGKEAAVTYSLSDKDNSYVSAKAQLYKGDSLVREVDLKNPNESLQLDNLEYLTDYTLKTQLTYNLGHENKEELQESVKTFRLEPKKIELKNIQSAVLYKKDGDKITAYESLEIQPTDVSQYFVKVKSDLFKDVLLPVSSITEENKDGQSFYKVKVSLSELVQEKSGKYQEDYSIEIAKSIPQQDVYTNFVSLVDAIIANPAGTFTLGANLIATDTNKTSYIPGNFTGRLNGSYNGKNYAIYDLKKPLFNQILNATVENLDLKNVSIHSNLENIGSLAVTAISSTVTNVSAQGKLTGQSYIGGLIALANQLNMTNSSFEGELYSNQSGNNGVQVGGLVGDMNGTNSNINKSKANVTIVSAAKNNDQRFGGLAGRVSGNALISNSYASGNIISSTGKGRLGGIVGTTWKNGRLQNVISEVSVPNGFSVTGDNYKDASIKEAYSIIGKATANDMHTKAISEEDANNRKAQLGITTSLEDSEKLANKYEVDYTKLPNATEERSVAYKNIEKLMPFYNKEWIVYYGNKVDTSSKLYTTPLKDVVPMADNQVVMDLLPNERYVNKLMLHYNDNTIEYLDLKFKENFKNSHIAEYDILNTNLIYTPEQFLSNYNNVISRVIDVLSPIVYDSEEMRNALGMQSKQDMTNLYLEREFDKIKMNLASELRKMLNMENAINTDGKVIEDYLVKKLTENPAQLLLGLTYLNRWYNISYDDINAKDLMVYKTDFLGKQNVSTIDRIIDLGKSGFELLQAKNNVTAYVGEIAQTSDEKELFSYLEQYRQLFLPNKTNNEWFKENTKAYIKESKSNIEEVRALQENAERNSKYNIAIYDRITAKDWEYQNMILPLLTLPEKGVYLLSNMATVSVGSYDRYRDKAEHHNNQDSLNKYVESKADNVAVWQRDHFDFWYKILTPEVRDRLFRKLLNYDGFGLKNISGKEYWSDLKNSSNAFYNFLGPVGKHYKDNGAGAYATGSVTHFVWDRILDQYGTSVFTHEMVHNSDSNIYFEGHGRREGQGAELFALGLLQVPTSLENDIIGINSTFSGAADSKKRFHTANPAERFKNEDDLNQYMHGMFDSIYVLDYAEAKSLLKQNSDVKKEWFRKIENYYVQIKEKDTHGGNKVRKFTDEEIEKLNTFESLIDNDVITRRGYRDSENYGRNGYYTTGIVNPIYSALSNSKGAPGDLMFRRIAYELLAAKGYHEGFIPYVSGKYSKEAYDSGSRVWSSWLRKDVGLVTDDLVLSKVFNGQYSTWADFKKAMFQERINKLGKLKPITIEYELGKGNSTKKVTISSYDQLQELMDQAVARDITNLSRATTHPPASWVNTLKQKLYNAYLRETDDFRTSMFGE